LPAAQHGKWRELCAEIELSSGKFLFGGASPCDIMPPLFPSAIYIASVVAF
jgi:hypothetical protein